MRRTRLLSALLLAAYGAFLLELLVFKRELLDIGPLIIKFAAQGGGEQANLIPFRTIWPYLLGEPRWSIAIVNLVGNIALFVPVGVLVPLAYRRMTLQTSLLLAVAFSLAIEALQAAFRVGIFDVDDVLLNALGVIAGCWFRGQRGATTSPHEQRSGAR